MTTQAFPSGCGLTVNYPHPSGTVNNQIHTRIDSACSTLPLVTNKIEAKTFRARWYGWENLPLIGGSSATGTAPSSKAQNLRYTAALKCTFGDLFRYRTEAKGTIWTGAQTYTASVYEQNDSEIKCGAKN